MNKTHNKKLTLEDLAVMINNGFQGQMEYMNTRFAEMNARFTEMDARFTKLEKRADAMDKRFEQIDKRFEQLEHKLEVKITYVQRQIDSLAVTVGQIKKVVMRQPSSKQFENLKKRVTVS